jgi:hypothetical protein
MEPLENCLQPVPAPIWIGKFVNIYNQKGELLYPTEVVDVYKRGNYLEGKFKLRISGPNFPIFIYNRVQE